MNAMVCLGTSIRQNRSLYGAIVLLLALYLIYNLLHRALFVGSPDPERQ